MALSDVADFVLALQLFTSRLVLTHPRSRENRPHPTEPLRSVLLVPQDPGSFIAHFIPYIVQAGALYAQAQPTLILFQHDIAEMGTALISTSKDIAEQTVSTYLAGLALARHQQRASDASTVGSGYHVGALAHAPQPNTDTELRQAAHDMRETARDMREAAQLLSNMTQGHIDPADPMFADPPARKAIKQFTDIPKRPDLKGGSVVLDMPEAIARAFDVEPPEPVVLNSASGKVINLELKRTELRDRDELKHALPKPVRMAGTVLTPPSPWYRAFQEFQMVVSLYDSKFDCRFDADLISEVQSVAYQGAEIVVHGVLYYKSNGKPDYVMVRTIKPDDE